LALNITFWDNLKELTRNKVMVYGARTVFEAAVFSLGKFPPQAPKTGPYTISIAYVRRKYQMGLLAKIRFGQFMPGVD